MGNLNNLDIRIMVSKSGFSHKAVAREIGVTPSYFSQLLRQEIKPVMRARIIEDIERMREEEDGEKKER